MEECKECNKYSVCGHRSDRNMHCVFFDNTNIQALKEENEKLKERGDEYKQLFFEKLERLNNLINQRDELIEMLKECKSKITEDTLQLAYFSHKDKNLSEPIIEEAPLLDKLTKYLKQVKEG